MNWREDRGESEVGEDRRASGMEKMSCEKIGERVRWS